MGSQKEEKEVRDKRLRKGSSTNGQKTIKEINQKTGR